MQNCLTADLLRGTTLAGFLRNNGRRLFGIFYAHLLVLDSSLEDLRAKDGACLQHHDSLRAALVELAGIVSDVLLRGVWSAVADRQLSVRQRQRPLGCSALHRARVQCAMAVTQHVRHFALFLLIVEWSLDVGSALLHEFKLGVVRIRPSQHSLRKH